MVIILLCMPLPGFYTFNPVNTVQIAVYYGGVGHHIQELGEDNLAAFYKVSS